MHYRNMCPMKNKSVTHKHQAFAFKYYRLNNRTFYEFYVTFVGNAA